MTNYPGYGRYGKKPIRRDRVLLVALFGVAIIFASILLRSGCSRSDVPLTVIDDGLTATTEGATSILPVIDGVATGPLVNGILTGSGEGTEATTIRGTGIATHVVEDGETLSDVAAALGVSMSRLLASNQLYGSEALQPGDVLYASTSGVLHLIKGGQTLTDISLSYGVPVATITEANGISPATTIYAGDRIIIPGATSTFWDNVVTLSMGAPSRFIWPLGGEMVSTFGWRVHPVLGQRHHHDGIDIDVPEGTIVHASSGGEVYFSGEQPGYGTVVMLEHPDNYFTVYGHLANVFVYQGQYVEAGQAIAQSGNTGISSGPHLHFEIRNGSFPIDPIRYLP